MLSVCMYVRSLSGIETHLIHSFLFEVLLLWILEDQSLEAII